MLVAGPSCVDVGGVRNAPVAILNGHSHGVTQAAIDFGTPKAHTGAVSEVGGVDNPS